ncbi:MAG TPA: hypothetical protein VEA80_06505 [Vitreimonas sp.]|uniref:hypothetical protein n=1 Tax=Vitreimonas sp. TaxID=3069702 RepID=UPI002D695F5D|nr:hypothetical protein [Vitreimonas sp.]HYD87104.1 hypothetical protein [Vitreimonas sp.]
MTFDDIFAAAPIGARLAVSDGRPQPPERAVQRLRAWRSHNFEGPLEEKLEASESQPRRLKIRAVDQLGLTVSYTVAENVEHTFTLLD